MAKPIIYISEPVLVEQVQRHQREGENLHAAARRLLMIGLQVLGLPKSPATSDQMPVSGQVDCNRQR